MITNYTNNKKYIGKENVGTLIIDKTNVYYLITNDNIPLFEYLYNYSYNDNSNIETGYLVDFNLIPVLQDNKGFYVTKQTYFYVLQFNEYDLGLNKNNKNMQIPNITKIDKTDELLGISRILYENRINIIISIILFLKNINLNEVIKQKSNNSYKSLLEKGKNKTTILIINDNIDYLIDKLYFIYSTINDNSLLFYKNSYNINNYFRNQLDNLLNKYQFIVDYFYEKENSNNQIGGSDIISNNKLSNKKLFIDFLLNIHKHDNKYFRGFQLLNMENSVYPIKNYYVKNKLTDIEYRDALSEVDKKYKEIINSNYIILSNYLNYYFPKEGKFAYEYINLKNARNFSFLKKIFPNDFHKVFNSFKTLLDSEIAEILKLIKFKNKKNTFSLRNNQKTNKKQSNKKKTIINLNRINVSNVKANLINFLNKPSLFMFNGMNIDPLLLFQKYPDIFKQYYPKYYNDIYLLDDNTFNNIVSQKNMIKNINFRNV